MLMLSFQVEELIGLNSASESGKFSLSLHFSNFVPHFFFRLNPFEKQS